MNNESAERQQNSTAVGRKKSSKKQNWFKLVISTLLALVTVLGAWVAWRANVAGNDSGDNDSSGLLALQNAQETTAVSYIEGNGHEIAYIDYLRNRKLAISMLTDGTLDNVSPADADRIARTITETLDLANTNRAFFFPGRYLDQNDDYDFNREINEAYAQAEQSKDLDYQAHFDKSDAQSNKVMGLVSMLVVLAISLWLLALSEVVSSLAKYASAAGGLIFMILGGVAAYLIDSDQMSAADVGAFTLPASWILVGITLAAMIALALLSMVRTNRSNKAYNATTAHAAITPSAPSQAGQPLPPGTPADYNPQLGPNTGYGAPPPVVPEAVPVAEVEPANPVYFNAGEATIHPVSTTAELIQEARDEGAAEQEEKEEPFKRIITVLIATVALIASIVAYLQSDASNNSGSANRNVQQYSLQALGENTYGASEMSYDYNTVTQAWKQLDVLALSADRHGDTVAAKRYRDAKDALQTQSSIFDAKYFNPDTQGLPDDAAYAADLYQAKAVNLRERSVVQLGLHSAWDGKASAYIAHLTLLAVALALFGLSLASSSFVRYIFAGAGVVMVAATIVWAIGVYSEPVDSIKDSAIDSYSQGIGQEEAGQSTDAIASFTDALNQEPGYANAIYERGNVYFGIATSAYAASNQSDEQGKTADAQASYKEYTDNLQLAIKDYIAAQKAGKDDSYTGWNLGWSYYLLGDFDNAITTDRHVLDKDPGMIGVRLNLGIALMAQGKFEDAETEYNTGIARTYDQIQAALDKGKTVSSDFWFYLDASVADLDNLTDRLTDLNFSFTLAPPKDKVADATATSDEAVSVVYTLRDKISQFEYLAKNGQMPAASTSTADVTSFTFGAVVEGKPDEQTGSVFPDGTKSVKAYYSFTGIKDGQTVSFKVYNDYFRYPEYDYTIDSWPNGESGDRWITVTDPYDAYSEAYNLGDGIWTIEMYVDNKLAQRGFFYVETAAETALDTPGTTTP